MSEEHSTLGWRIVAGLRERGSMLRAHGRGGVVPAAAAARRFMAFSPRPLCVPRGRGARLGCIPPDRAQSPLRSDARHRTRAARSVPSPRASSRLTEIERGAVARECRA